MAFRCELEGLEGHMGRENTAHPENHGAPRRQSVSLLISLFGPFHSLCLWTWQFCEKNTTTILIFSSSGQLELHFCRQKSKFIIQSLCPWCPKKSSWIRADAIGTGWGISSGGSQCGRERISGCLSSILQRFIKGTEVWGQGWAGENLCAELRRQPVFLKQLASMWVGEGRRSLLSLPLPEPPHCHLLSWSPCLLPSPIPKRKWKPSSESSPACLPLCAQYHTKRVLRRLALYVYMKQQNSKLESLHADWMMIWKNLPYSFSLKVRWTARRSNQSDLKEIRPEYSSEGLMLKWSSNNLATWCEQLTHWKIPWCWERWKAGGEGDDRGWDG